MPDSTRPGSIDVEALLADLAAHVEWPPLPDSVAAARNRLAAGEAADRRSPCGGRRGDGPSPPRSPPS